MASFASFRFPDLAALRAQVGALAVDLPLADDLAPLARPVAVGPYRTPNALAVQPMEGCDSTPSGAPGELTFRRYRRFAQGGAGLIWFEATAVNAAARANPHQLYLHKETLPAFSRLVDATRRAAAQAMGPRHEPLLVLQITHSGRYSRPTGPRQPIIAQHHALLDPALGLAPDYPLIADAELERLVDDFAQAAVLAHQAGFHAVDLKACHGYLAWELLSARTRPGRYGGDLAGRSRFLLAVLEAVRQRAGKDLLLAVRLNFYDGYPYPHGWGADRDDPARLDLAEPLELTRQLVARGLALLNVTAGVPQNTPQVTRPFDKPLPGALLPGEHPLEGVARLFALARAAQTAFPTLPVVSSGYSWLRHYAGHAAAANIAGGTSQLAAFGRLAIAYPDFAGDLLQGGGLARSKACLCCSKCSEIMIKGGPTGCVTRDADVYLPLYRQYCQPGSESSKGESR